MLGAIAGDIIGSVHEYSGTKTPEFELFHAHCRFTDDTVLAVAVAAALRQRLLRKRSTVVYRRQSLSAPLVCWTSICARSHWPFVSAIH